MAARYSDRFFGPQGVRGGGDSAADDPTGTAVPPRHPYDAAPDEIDLAAGAGPSAPSSEPSYAASPGRPWHAEMLARTALVAALVVGAVGGAYGWDRWRDRQAELVAQSMVDVNAELSLLNVDPASQQMSLSVRLRNKGPHTITVTGFTPLDPRMTATDADFEPTDVAAGAEFIEVVDFGLDCSVDVEPDDDPSTAVLAHLRTMDGAEHDESFSLVAPVMGYGGGVAEQCSYFQPTETFQELYPEISSAEIVGTGAVESDVAFSSYNGQLAGKPDIASVEAPSSAFDVTWDGSYTDEFDTLTITVMWSVEDCTAALRADDMDMLVNVRGSMPSESSTSTTTAYPSTRLIAQLVRLSELVCR